MKTPQKLKILNEIKELRNQKKLKKVINKNFVFFELLNSTKKPSLLMSEEKKEN